MNVNQEQIRANLLSATFWVRVVFMAIFVLVLWVLSLALAVICVVQTLILLVSGELNQPLRRLAVTSTDYLRQVVAFLLFVTEEKPFPFAPLPNSAVAASATAEDTAADGSSVAATTAPPDSAAAAEADATSDVDDSFYDPERDSGASR
jgi:hypothetical protein